MGCRENKGYALLRLFPYQFIILSLVFMYRVTTSLPGEHSNCSYSKPWASVKSSWPSNKGWRLPGPTHTTQLNRPVSLQPPAICSNFTCKGELRYPLPGSSLQRSVQRKKIQLKAVTQLIRTFSNYSKNLESKNIHKYSQQCLPHVVTVSTN